MEIKMQDVSVILKLIARGLIDIRTAANSGNAKACFILSDFIHVLPHTANCMVNDGRCYEDVVHDLYERAKIKNMDDWLENALNDIELNQKNHSK
ncbi:TPA: hypothetical protein ACWMKV_000444 [Escherichia coli]|uniref:hypothetical protein n=1 Tax=Escherichia coli TaxID=562 RepID=UPI0017F977B8|nr:hypothetical protein [Escherichia coli]MCN2194006.1 hypothetical protein [Escherichia coli]MCO1302949.1 hypothetical protein [Escherichia coli]MDK6255609.1 hypothetical protein [Escherichia coli]MEA1167018.1 hypothetical protein [Escherichia coli]HAI7368888.1 hypothetical protein [Escherichia coli]